MDIPKGHWPINSYLIFASIPIIMITCAICQDLFCEPKILPCLHSFCAGCLKEWSGNLANLDLSKRHLECPLCRAKVLLSTAHSVEELLSHFLPCIHLVEIVCLQEQASSKRSRPFVKIAMKEKTQYRCV